MQARLLDSYEIAPEVRHFVFDVPEAEKLNFVPGQFVSLSGTVAGKKVTRAYSIVSPPNGNRFELCLNRVNEGLFSPFLFDLTPEALIDIKGPLGHFVPKTPFGDSVLIGTGTGVAPFRSFLLDDGLLSSNAAITLVFGARYEHGLLYRSEFEDLAAKRPGFRFLPTLTRPSEGWTGRTGRVQEHLDDALQGRTDVDVYICGLKEMVNDLRERLKERGFEKAQIIAEKYD